MQTHEHVREHELGDLLRYWRHERGKSQLDLSLDTGISQRHLSFVESGRSVPSRDLLSIVSEKLDIPLRERNVLLLASGHWLGPFAWLGLIPLAGSALLFWTGYRLQHSVAS